MLTWRTTGSWVFLYLKFSNRGATTGATSEVTGTSSKLKVGFWKSRLPDATFA